MSKIFLDTNLLVYAHDRSQPDKRRRAKESLALLRQPQYEALISTQVMQEFYNALTRKLGFSPLAAKQEILLLGDIPVVSTTSLIVLNAIDLCASSSISIWDALIVAAAQSAACDELWTEDLQSGRSFGSLRVVNPL